MVPTTQPGSQISDNHRMVPADIFALLCAVNGGHKREKLKTLLYLDAFRPQKVRTPQGSFDPKYFGSFKPGEWTIPLTEEILDDIGKDVKGPDRKWMVSKATPWPMKHSTEPVTLSKSFDTVKSTYIFCTGGGDPVDEILKGKWGKLDGPHKVIELGHWPMITKPTELVKDMLNLSG
jgi:hypothetical protein